MIRSILAFVFGLGLITSAQAQYLFPIQQAPGGGGSSVPAPPAFQGTVHQVSPSSDVQGVINSAAAGDTIFFQPGSYNIGTLALKSSLLYVSASQTYPLLGFSDRAVINCGAWNTASNDVVYGLNFVSCVGNISGDSDTVTNVDLSGSANSNGGFLNVANLSNSTIQWSTAHGGALLSGAGSSGPALANVTITRNAILGVSQPLSINPTGSTINGLNITFNYMDAAGVTTRFSLECANGGPSNAFNVAINDNYVITNNDGLSVVSCGSAEVARNFIRRISGGTAYFGGIEASSASPEASPFMNVHDNYIRNEAPGETTGFNAGVYGSYDGADAAHWTNNNELNTDDANLSGAAIVTGTTHNDLGIPTPPATGDAP